ncbi:conserved Plasmodium protein, unknown function [Plasmodium chabaudi adami]|uniref:Uncharacterized protein n=1 Tax=Plasmodium chabaudi adami TaxID=5826 RepID=A0A1C6YHT8_PLACE|nr:conserved Plasmodium protein, unknown function [Plasmodium chabaudi adami]
MENHNVHSIDIKSEDFVVLIALQSLQTFIVTGYAAIDSKKLVLDFKYLWTVLLGTALFISSLISFVIIRAFVYSKNSIGKYILELLFFFSIVITCILSIIFDSFKISNMQLLFFAFSLTGYSYYNLITLLFFSVLLGIIIQYNLVISGFMFNAKYILFSDIISYALQIIGGHALYFRMYKLCNLIVMSKKNPCKYVVISKEVKNLEEQIFKKLIKSYICINSKTYSDISSINDNSNNDHKSIRDNFLDLKFKSLNTHRDSKYMKKYKLLNSKSEFNKFNYTTSFSKYYNTKYSKLYHNSISKNSNIFPLKIYSNIKPSNNLHTFLSKKISNKFLKKKKISKTNFVKHSSSSTTDHKHTSNYTEGNPINNIDSTQFDDDLEQIQNKKLIKHKKKKTKQVSLKKKASIISSYESLNSYANQSNKGNHELAIQIKESSTEENLSQYNDKHSLESLPNHHSTINIHDKNIQYGVHFSKKTDKESEHTQDELIASSGKTTKRDAKQTKSKLTHENIKHNKGKKKGSSKKIHMEISSDNSCNSNYDTQNGYDNAYSTKAKDNKIINKNGPHNTYNERMVHPNYIKSCAVIPTRDYKTKMPKNQINHIQDYDCNILSCIYHEQNNIMNNIHIANKNENNYPHKHYTIYDQPNSTNKQSDNNNYDDITATEHTIDILNDTFPGESELIENEQNLPKDSSFNYKTNKGSILRYKSKHYFNDDESYKFKKSLDTNNDTNSYIYRSISCNNNKIIKFTQPYYNKNNELNYMNTHGSNYKYDKSKTLKQYQIMDKIIELDIYNTEDGVKKYNKKRIYSIAKKKKTIFSTKKGKTCATIFLENTKMNLLFIYIPRFFKTIIDVSKKTFLNLKKKKILMQNAIWKNKIFIPEANAVGLFKNPNLEQWYLSWMDEFNINLIIRTYFMNIYLIIYIMLLDFITAYKLYNSNIILNPLKRSNFLKYYIPRSIINIFMYIFYILFISKMKKRQYCNIKKYYNSTLLLCLAKFIITSFDIYIALTSLKYFTSPYYIYMYIHMLTIQTTILLIVRYPTQYFLFFIYIIMFISLYCSFAIVKSFMEFSFIITCISFNIIYSYILCSRTIETNRRILFSKYELPYILYLKEIVHCLSTNPTWQCN